MKFLYLIFTIFTLLNCSLFSFMKSIVKDIAVERIFSDIQEEAMEYRIEKLKKAKKPIEACVDEKELFKSMIKPIKPLNKGDLWFYSILKAIWPILFLVWIYFSMIDFFGFLIPDDISGYILSAVIRCIFISVSACLYAEFSLFPALEFWTYESNYEKIYKNLIKE